jgi:hypothetical protein
VSRRVWLEGQEETERDKTLGLRRRPDHSHSTRATSM